jgi:membrane-associated phospholipid phosphatase
MRKDGTTMIDTNHSDRLARALSGLVSRRAALRGLGGAGLASALAVAAHRGVGAAESAEGASPVEPDAGSWSPWVLRSGDQFRLPPPDEAGIDAELAQLEALAADRDAAALASIAYWDAGAPPYRWNYLTIQHLLGNGVVGLRAARALALLNVAIADATVAAWDTKYAHQRPRPAAARPALATAVPTPNSPAYPSEHAVTAGAAAAVLGAIFPDAAASFAALAEEAGRSRLLAGTDYPSDVAAGMALGRQVAELVIERAQTDGSDAVWTGSVPTEPGKWNGTKPYEPLGGTWQPWVLESGDQFRPGPPPAYDSAQMEEELAELKTFERTNLTNLTASYWEYYGGRASFELYTNQLSRKLFEERLDRNPPRAARAYALMDVALYDVFVACWDAKYAFWAIRPFMLDAAVTTVFVTPNHPSYPAAHASVGGAMETVLGALFPQDAAYFERLAEEESWSRLWAGIHFRSDIEAGRALGRAVGQAVLARAATDGAD